MKTEFLKVLILMMTTFFPKDTYDLTFKISF